MMNHEADATVYHANKNLQLFFNNILEIKEFVRQKSEDSQDPILKEVFYKLDKVIKENPNV